MHKLTDLANKIVENEKEYQRSTPDLLDEPYAEPFWQSLKDENIQLQYCDHCDEYQYFPRPWCMYCKSNRIEWKEVSGRGHVFTYTIIRRSVMNPTFEDEIPYIVAYVEVEEGPRILARVDGDLDDVSIGTPVEIMYEHVTDEVTLPVFEPVE